MITRILITVVTVLALCGCGSPAPAAILVQGSNGTYAVKTTLAAAAAAADAAGKTVVVTHALSAVQSNISSATLHGWPADRKLVITADGSLGNTTTFRFLGESPDHGARQVFAGAGSIVGLKEARPEWWGSGGAAATVAAAVNSLVAGGTVRLLPTVYISPYDTEAGHLTKNSVTFAGAKMPNVNAGNTALENGTIIQGSFMVFAHNVTVLDLGVDCGLTVCDALYGGTSQEGFTIANLSTHPAATAPFKGFRAENIQVLLKDTAGTTMNHGFLCEYVDGAFVKNIRTQYGLHGIVFKATNSTGIGLWAKDCTGEGVIIKSDSYAQSGQSSYSGINIQSTTQGVGGGLVLFAASDNLGHIDVSDVIINNTSFGLQINGLPGNVAEDITINKISITNVTGFGVQVSATANYVTIIDGVVNSGLNTGFLIELGATNIDLVRCRARANGVRGFDIASLSTRLFDCTSAANTIAGLNVATPSLQMEGGRFGDGIVYAAGAVSMTTDADIAVTNPALSNSWVDFGGGNPVAAWWVDNGRVRLAGLIKSGTLGTTIFTLPVGARPASAKRFHVLCYNGVTAVTGEMIISAAGEVSLSYGANNYVSLDGVEFSLAFD